MSERSDPLGPPAQSYPVGEYTLVSPEADEIVDTVRIELLSLTPAADRARESGPTWFDASLQFAIDGVSWPLRLSYAVSFVSAWPCSDGSHPLFFDYVYHVIKVDEIVEVRDWNGTAPDGRDTKGKGKSAAAQAYTPAGNHDDEKVLVVEAFGVPDNEVLARAWCAHWGLNAVVADIGKTW
jgi:hypothetical protein